MERYSHMASSATTAVATTTKGKDPFKRSSRTKGTRTAAVMTRFMISEKDTR
jgi:hypothetical protein